LARIYLQLSGSVTTPGPFNIYQQSISDSNLIQENVSVATLQLANVQYIISDSTTQMVLKNMNPACKGKYVTVPVVGLAPTPTPSFTPYATATPSATTTLTPTPTLTATLTPGLTQTPTPPPTATATPTLTPTPTAVASVTIPVTLTIDVGNTGYTQIYASGSSGYTLKSTLTTNGSSYNLVVTTGTKFFTVTVQQSRAYSYQVAEAILNVNGVPDAASPYIQTNIGSAAETISVATYGGDGHPTATYPNTYSINTYIGNQR
jgi:hypothetical protein